ncbi:MAG: FecR family protein [Lachnospiraceae bacterium]|nr:FecR family protein [Lachnospiraceae bacterium]
MKSKSTLYKGAILLLIFPIALACSSCGKENAATTMNLIKTEGTVDVDDAKGKSLKLMENMGLYSGYGIGTQSESYAWINFDDVKLSKLDQDSRVSIEKDGRKLEIDVQSGSIFFNITEALGENESMDIRTSTMTCGIRGTCGWVMANGSTSCLTLLDGTVECIILVDGQEETVTVNAKESLIVDEDDGNITYEMVPLTFDDVPEFVQEEVVNEPLAMEENSDSNGESEESGTQTENDIEMSSDDEDSSQEEQGSEAGTDEAVPGKEIGFFDATGLYVLENNGKTDEVTLSLEAYTDDINGGPLCIYIGQSTMVFDGEWVLSDDEDSFRDGVVYNATDSNGNTLSFVLDTEAAGVTITSANDGFKSIEGHYVIQSRYEAP